VSSGQASAEALTRNSPFSESAMNQGDVFAVGDLFDVSRVLDGSLTLDDAGEVVYDACSAESLRTLAVHCAVSSCASMDVSSDDHRVLAALFAAADAACAFPDGSAAGRFAGYPVGCFLAVVATSMPRCGRVWQRSTDGCPEPPAVLALCGGGADGATASQSLWHRVWSVDKHSRMQVAFWGTLASLCTGVAHRPACESGVSALLSAVLLAHALLAHFYKDSMAGVVGQRLLPPTPLVARVVEALQTVLMVLSRERSARGSMVTVAVASCLAQLSSCAWVRTVASTTVAALNSDVFAGGLQDAGTSVTTAVAAGAAGAAVVADEGVSLLRDMLEGVPSSAGVGVYEWLMAAVGPPQKHRSRGGEAAEALQRAAVAAMCHAARLHPVLLEMSPWRTGSDRRAPAVLKAICEVAIAVKSNVRAAASTRAGGDAGDAAVDAGDFATMCSEAIQRARLVLQLAPVDEWPSAKGGGPASWWQPFVSGLSVARAGE
jgi:hypothetical protein